MGLGSSCVEYTITHYFVLLMKSENILLNIFFMQLGKMEMHHYHMRLPSPLIGDAHPIGVSRISLQREMSS
jgi:hypothetical protein